MTKNNAVHTRGNRRPNCCREFLAATGRPVYRVRHKNVIPYISGIAADFMTKFTKFTDEDSGYVSCKFY